ncbi:MAG: DASS family sodium-coupled anion symporter [Thermoanaerobaculia bacterium]|nr:DASS family sodium-coupled anion symporter [Thermoanaerobaculia bacterium]
MPTRVQRPGSPAGQRRAPGPAESSAYRDSRRASQRIYSRVRERLWPSLLSLVAVVVAAGVLWRFAGPLEPSQRWVLLLFLLAVGLWATEAVPAFAVGLLIIGYLVLVLGTRLVMAEPLDVSAYTDTWSSPVIWMLLGGFFLAEGLARTGLDRRLFAAAIRPAGDRPQRVLLAVMLATAIGSMFVSNSSTTALMIGAVTPVVAQIGRSEPFARALLVGVPAAASVGGMGTIIGSAPNAIAVGVAENFGATIDFVDWMLVGVPLALALVLVAWRWLLFRYPPTLERIEIDLGSVPDPPLASRRDRRIVVAVTVLTVVLWMTSPLHGVHVAAVSLIPIVGLTMTSIVGAHEVRGLPWDTLMLVAGGLSLGAAVVDTGLAEAFLTRLAFLGETDSPAVGLLLLALLTVALSNFMSNTATVSLVLPVAVALFPGREIEVCFVLGLSASCALLLPVSTPPNAIAYSTGALETRDFRPVGLLVGLGGPALVLAWVLTIGSKIG